MSSAQGCGLRRLAGCGGQNGRYYSIVCQNDKLPSSGWKLIPICQRAHVVLKWIHQDTAPLTSQSFNAERRIRHKNSEALSLVETTHLNPPAGLHTRPDHDNL
jgi:hypothetical protein